MAVVNLDDPRDVAAWNRRAPTPAPTDAAPAGMEPVATVLFSSTGWRTLVDALASLEDGTKLYTASQVQAMLAAARKPLTDEKLHALYADEMAEYFVDALHYWKGTSAHQYARAIEHAHGIKATNQESNK